MKEKRRLFQRAHTDRCLGKWYFPIDSEGERTNGLRDGNPSAPDTSPEDATKEAELCTSRKALSRIP